MQQGTTFMQHHQSAKANTHESPTLAPAPQNGTVPPRIPSPGIAINAPPRIPSPGVAINAPPRIPSPALSLHKPPSVARGPNVTTGSTPATTTFAPLLSFPPHLQPQTNAQPSAANTKYSSLSVLTSGAPQKSLATQPQRKPSPAVIASAPRIAPTSPAVVVPPTQQTETFTSPKAISPSSTPLPFPLHEMLPPELLASIAAFLPIYDRLTKFRILSSSYNAIMQTQQESALDLTEASSVASLSSVASFTAMFGNVAVSGIIMDDVLIDIILEHLDLIKHQIRHVRMICLSGDNGREYFEKSIKVLRELDHLVELSACFSSFVSRSNVSDLVGTCFKLLAQKTTLKHLHIEGHLWWRQKIMAFPHIEVLEKTELADFESLPVLRVFEGDMCIPSHKWELLRCLESIHMRTANASMKSLVETLQHGASFIKSVSLQLKDTTQRDRIIQVTRLMKGCENLDTINVVSERRDDILGEEIIPLVGGLIKELNLSNHFYIEDIHSCPRLHTLELQISDLQQSDISSKKPNELTHLMCHSVRTLKLSCVQNLISIQNLLKWIQVFPNANWNDPDIGMYIIISTKMHQEDDLSDLIDFVRKTWLEDDRLYYMGLHREWINKECDILVRFADEFWQKVKSEEVTEWQHLFYMDTDQKLQAEQEALHQFLENIEDVIYPLKYLCFEYIVQSLYGNANDFTE